MLKSGHILYKVNNIKTTVRKLTDMGFNVQWGSHPSKAHNALVWFDDGPFIEFFQLPKYAYYLFYPFIMWNGKGSVKRWKRWYQQPEGWCDIAIEPSVEENVFDLFPYQEHLRKLDIGFSKIIKGKRKRPDGDIVRYNLMLLEKEYFPFLVSHYDPPQRPKSIIHPNGVKGVKCVELKLPVDEISKIEELCKDDDCLQLISSSFFGIGSVTFRGSEFKLEDKI